MRELSLPTTNYLRANSPTPNRLSNSGLNSTSPKPPTPTGSPKLLRPKTPQNGSLSGPPTPTTPTAPTPFSMASVTTTVNPTIRNQALRQSLDIESDDDDELIPLSEIPDSPTNRPLNEDIPIYCEGRFNTPEFDSSSSSPVPSSPKGPHRTDKSPDSTESNDRGRLQTVNRTQSLREPIIQKFGTAFSSLIQERADKAAIKEAQKALSSANHSRPIIKGGTTNNNSTTELPDTASSPVENNSERLPLVEKTPSNRSSSEERLPTNHPFRSHPVSRSGVVVPPDNSVLQHIRSKKSEELAEGTTTPMSLCASATFSSPTPTLVTKDLSSAEYILPNREPLPFEKDKKSTSSSTNSNTNRGATSNTRPSRLRRNVQVLPDKNLLKEKTNSSECLTTADVISTNSSTSVIVSRKRGDGSGGSSEGSDQLMTHTPRPPLFKRPVATHTDSDDNSETEAPTMSHPPTTRLNTNLPPRGNGGNNRSSFIKSKPHHHHHKHNSSSKISSQRPLSSSVTKDSSPSRNSESGSIGLKPEDTDECDSLPDETTLIMAIQSDGEANDSSLADKPLHLKTGSQELNPNLQSSSEKRTVPQIRHPAARQVRQQTQKSQNDEIVSSKLPASPIQHSTFGSPSKIRLNKSTSPPNNSGTGTAGRLSPGGVPSSPHKTVTWNLRPDVVKYDDINGEESRGTQSASEDITGSTNGHRKSKSHRSFHHHHHHHRSRTGATNKIATDEKLISSNSTSSTEKTTVPYQTHIRRHSSDDKFQEIDGLNSRQPKMVLIHENFIEQTTKMLNQQMKALNDVKEGTKQFDDYRQLTLDQLQVQQNAITKLLNLFNQKKTTFEQQLQYRTN